MKTEKVNKKISVKQKMLMKVLESHGYDLDLNKPAKTTLHTINTLIEQSVPSFISKQEMIKFLERQVDKLEQE